MDHERERDFEHYTNNSEMNLNQIELDSDGESIHSSSSSSTDDDEYGYYIPLAEAIFGSDSSDSDNNSDNEMRSILPLQNETIFDEDESQMHVNSSEIFESNDSSSSSTTPSIYDMYLFYLQWENENNIYNEDDSSFCFELYRRFE